MKSHPATEDAVGHKAMQSTVSVCIATCNQRDYISKCLESALGQDTNAVIEILVGDDCSDDGTSEILAAYAAAHPRIKHIRHQQRLGASTNMLALFRCAGGRYIAHLDGDDYWLPEKIRLQVDYLDHHPECAAVYTNALTVREDGHTIGIFNDAGDGQYDLAAMIRRGNFLNTSSMMFRSALKGSLVEIDRPCVDYRLHLLLAQRGLLAHLGQPMAAYRVNAHGAMTSTSGDLVRQLYWEAMLSVPPHLIGTGDTARGMADFLRRVLGAARRQRRWNLVRTWAPQVFAASPYGTLGTCLLVLAAYIRISRAEIASRWRPQQSSKHTRVLYHR